jgi:hypothetical protein
MRGTRYTVPSALANRSVAVRTYAEHFEVLDPMGRIAFSRRYVADEDKGRLQIDKTHYAALPRRRRVPGGERLDEALLLRFPTLAVLVQGLRLRFKSLAPIHYRALIRLVDCYGEPAFLEAAERAQQYRRFDSLAIRRILEQDHPLPEHDRPAPLTGLGPLVLGEVEPGSLETYGGLDATPAASTEPPTSNAPPASSEPLASSDSNDPPPPQPPSEPGRDPEEQPSPNKESRHGS